MTTLQAPRKKGNARDRFMENVETVLRHQMTSMFGNEAPFLVAKAACELVWPDSTFALSRDADSPDEVCLRDLINVATDESAEELWTGYLQDLVLLSDPEFAKQIADEIDREDLESGKCLDLGDGRRVGAAHATPEQRQRAAAEAERKRLCEVANGIAAGHRRSLSGMTDCEFSDLAQRIAGDADATDEMRSDVAYEERRRLLAEKI